jgi:hypothetical protein
VGGLGPTEIDEQKKNVIENFFPSPELFFHPPISIIFSLVSLALLAFAAKVKRKRNLRNFSVFRGRPLLVWWEAPFWWEAWGPGAMGPA